MSASALRRRPFLDAERPLCFAHRGGSASFPENTLAAFRGALDLGVTFLESDVHLTRDGVLVVHHDDTVDRTTEGTGTVREMSLAELQRLDAGYRFTVDGRTHPFRGLGLTIPTLAELFALSDAARFNLELKGPGEEIVRRMWEVLQQLGLVDRVLIAAHEHEQVRRFRRCCRERVATSASAREALTFWLATRAHADRFLPVSYDALQVPVEHRGLTVVDRHFVRAAHRRGLQVHVWTIDEPQEMRRLLDLGVDGLMSDRPDRLVPLKGARLGPF